MHWSPKQDGDHCPLPGEAKGKPKTMSGDRRSTAGTAALVIENLI